VFDDEMLRIEDVAAYLKLKPQTIYKWAQKGRIPGAKFGKEWRFKRSAIERWIDSYLEGSGNKDGAVLRKQGPAKQGKSVAAARRTKPKKTRTRAKKKKARGPGRN